MVMNIGTNTVVKGSIFISLWMISSHITCDSSCSYFLRHLEKTNQITQKAHFVGPTFANV